MAGHEEKRLAEMIKTPGREMVETSTTHVSAWAPLREPLFRSMWLAAIVSYIGTWMQAVGAGWMMAVLTMSPVSYTHLTLPTNREV